MHEKEIDCISVGKVKPRKKWDWTDSLALTLTMVKIIALTAAEMLGTVIAIVGAGCLAGIGFGVGLALVTTLV